MQEVTIEATPSALDPISDVLEALRRGEIVVVVDDERRENEGDLIFAAELATPESINFLAHHGRGLICTALLADDLLRLGIPRMAPNSAGDKFGTAFMQSVDAARGITTGISAQDRARTIRLLADEATEPLDLVRPGHVFPLEAYEMGVLQRPGHTEAAVDLMRLAGLKPVGVICEILNEDGTMARLPRLREFKQEHGLCMISVADILLYRQRTETLVRCEQMIRLPTEFGTFQLHLYTFLPDGGHHLALTLGDVATGDPPLIRMHSECLTGDVFGSLRCDCGTQLRDAMRRIAEEGRGIILYLRQEGRGIGLPHKIHAYALQEKGMDTVEANRELGFDADLRDYAVGAQMLRHLGVPSVRLLTNNPAKIEGLSKYGIEIAERVSVEPAYTEHNSTYLQTKKAKLGHLI